jgi:iron complex outermembrane receptor protein
LQSDLGAFASQSELGDRYYDDAATKTDGNILQKPIIR